MRESPGFSGKAKQNKAKQKQNKKQNNNNNNNNNNNTNIAQAEEEWSSATSLATSLKTHVCFAVAVWLELPSGP